MEQGSNLFYYIFPIVITIIALAGYKKPKTGFLIMIILLFFSMFRGENVGNDTKNYMGEDRIQYRGGSLEVEFTTDFFLENLGTSTELIDIVLNRCVYNLKLPPRLIIWVYALISIIVLYNALRRLRVNTSIGLLIFVLSGLYYFSLSAARQMAAVSIVLYAFTFVVLSNNHSSLQKENRQIYKNDFARFLFLMLIAAMIHTSAIFYIVLYPIKFIRINKNIITILLCVVCLLCVLLTIDPMSYVYSFINIEYIIRYMGNYDEIGRSFMGRIVDFLTYSFLIYTFYKGTKKITGTADNIFALSILLMAVFGQTSGLIARITYFITIFMTVYISRSLLPCNTLKKDTLYYLFLMYVLLSIYKVGGYGSSALTSGYYLMF